MLSWAHLRVCSPPLCRTSTSNAVKAGLLKSSKTQFTPVTIFSVYYHLASTSGAWWQKLRDWGGASSLRPSGSLTQTQFHKHLQDSLLTVKHPYSHHPYCCYVYIPGTTRLHIPLAHPSCSYYYLLSPNILFLHILLVCNFYSIAHFTLYFSFFTYIYALVFCYFYIMFIFIILHCPLSGPDLIYISLLIIPCIIYYVTNKETLNLEPPLQCTPCCVMGNSHLAFYFFR